MASLPKHEKYEKYYKANEIYWGLGIENETYIEFAATVKTRAEFIKINQNRERYSVDYWKLYKPGIVQKIIDTWIAGLPLKEQAPISLPLLANAHTISKTDRYGQPETTYSVKPQSNPKFCGSTLLQDLSGVEPDVFSKGRDIWWTFDGDTVELITQNFYNAKMEDVIKELLEHKRIWMEAFKRGLATIEDKEDALKGVPRYPSKNYGFAVFLTNRNNVAIFNNGTYHFNITLPTQLDANKKIVDMEGFKRRHCMAARLFQWLSPFLVVRYGSPDVFANLSGDAAFPTGSQRLCASRYVSVGTYDTDTMPPGKVLLIPNTLNPEKKRWYDIIYSKADCPYEVLSNIGVDINYNKHWNHGLEFRIFDWFPEEMLGHVFRLLIWMCDESLRLGTVRNPQKSDVWNKLLARCVWDGCDVRLNDADVAELETVFGTNIFKYNMTVYEGFNAIWLDWFYRWNDSKGSCTELMIREPIVVPGVRHSRHNTLGYTVRNRVMVEAEIQTDPPLVVEPKSSWNCFPS